MDAPGIFGWEQYLKTEGGNPLGMDHSDPRRLASADNPLFSAGSAGPGT